MSIIFIEGFDHYGTDRLNMLDGVWAELTSTGFALSAANPRTGTHALRLTNSSSALTRRRIFGDLYETVGIGAAIYLQALPVANGASIFALLDNAANAQVSFELLTTGAIRVRRGGPNGGTVLASTADGVVTAAAYQHIECRTRVHSTEGAVEIRINGVTVLNASSLNTLVSEAGSRQIGLLYRDAAFGITMTVDFDDLYAWSPDGDTNNDFLGDLRVRTLFPDADTVINEWEPIGQAAGFECIDEPAPNDDTDYILAEPLTSFSPPVDSILSEFGLPLAEEAVAGITAVQTYTRMVKTEAGIANVRVSLVSGSEVSEGADRAITQEYTYWMDVHETDPDTGAPWTADGLAAAQLRIERTA